MKKRALVGLLVVPSLVAAATKFDGS